MKSVRDGAGGPLPWTSVLKASGTERPTAGPDDSAGPLWAVVGGLPPRTTGVALVGAASSQQQPALRSNLGWSDGAPSWQGHASENRPPLGQASSREAKTGEANKSPKVRVIAVSRLNAIDSNVHRVRDSSQRVYPDVPKISSTATPAGVSPRRWA
jgi:hypothetical protein